MNSLLHLQQNAFRQPYHILKQILSKKVLSLGMPRGSGHSSLQVRRKGKYQMHLELESSGTAGLCRIFIASLKQEGTVRA